MEEKKTLKPLSPCGDSELLPGEEAALRLLGRREHSEKELRDKLAVRGYPRQEIDAVITKCRLRGFLDEARWAQGVVRKELRKGKGPLYIRKLLAFNGIDRATIEALVSETSEIPTRLLSSCRGKNPHQAWAALSRRGFEPQVISKALRNVNRDIDLFD